MTKIRWIAAVAVVLVIAVGAVAATVFSVPSVQDRLVGYFIRRALMNQTARNARLFEDGALHVLLCGTSAPVPDLHRAEDCTAIIAGGKIYVVDAGPGSSRNLALWNLEDDHLGAVFMTHYQSDDIGDLGDISRNAWLYGHRTPLPVYGPPGIGPVVDGMNTSYATDDGNFAQLLGADRLTLASATMVPVAIPLLGPATPRKDRLSAQLHFGDLTVTAIEVDHAPVDPAYGYRFDYHGRSVVVSGDTRYHPPLALAAKGADVLVHEAQSLRLIRLLQHAAETTPGYAQIGAILGGIQVYHSDPKEAAQIANQAGVRLLILNHISPRLDNALITRMFLDGVDRIRPTGWRLGQDGMVVTLPPNSTEIDVTSIDR